MIDPFVLLAPLLLLGIVSLLVFVGCTFSPGAPPDPTSPTGLTAIPGDALVSLSWIAPDVHGGHALSYTIYPTVVGGPSRPPVTGILTPHYRDGGLTNGTIYIYRVSAVQPDYETPPSDDAQARPQSMPARPVDSVLDPSNPLVGQLVGLYLMNGVEGSGNSDRNLVDDKPAIFAGIIPPTWNHDIPCIAFHGGGPQHSFLDETMPAYLGFDELPIRQMTIVARVYANAPLLGAGVCEKFALGVPEAGFVFGWDNTGALHLTVLKSTESMRVATDAGAVVSGEWLQVACTWDGTGLDASSSNDANLFVNGISQTKNLNVDGTGVPGSASATDQPFRIGTADFAPIASGLTGSLNGYMAYLAVYRDRILTEAELAELDQALPIMSASPGPPL